MIKEWQAEDRADSVRDKNAPTYFAGVIGCPTGFSFYCQNTNVKK